MSTGLSPVQCRFESDSEHKCTREVIGNPIDLGSIVLSSNLSECTKESSPTARQLVLKTKMRGNTWGIDTSTLRQGISAEGDRDLTVDQVSYD